MNCLKHHKKRAIIHLLVEGNSIRSTSRLTNVHTDTIMRLLIRTARRCSNLMDQYMSELRLKAIQADEIWTFVRKKEKRLEGADLRNPTIGDQYIFVAIDEDTKLVPTFLVGRRDGWTAIQFMRELHNRLRHNLRFRLTTDAFPGYVDAVKLIFGNRVSFTQLVKSYAHKYPRLLGEKESRVSERIVKTITGKPVKKGASTSYVERQNLTMRRCIGRMVRRTNAFSKKFENLIAALDLHFAYYNFVRVHKTLGTTPAVEAGVLDREWEIEELIG